ncbi:MAG: hypothetical protein J6I32_06335 [Bacteroidaceae bacterium]|nr:hypothetical protein [Bacteroidaceae bacterium]
MRIKGKGKRGGIEAILAASFFFAFMAAKVEKDAQKKVKLPAKALLSLPGKLRFWHKMQIF